MKRRGEKNKGEKKKGGERNERGNLGSIQKDKSIFRVY